MGISSKEVKEAKQPEVGSDQRESRLGGTRATSAAGDIHCDSVEDQPPERAFLIAAPDQTHLSTAVNHSLAGLH